MPPDLNPAPTPTPNQELLWLRQMPPDGYCKAMGAKQDAKEAEEAAAGGSTQDIGRRRLGEAAEVGAGGAAEAEGGGADCHAISSAVSDQWCDSNCNGPTPTRLGVCWEAAERMVVLLTRTT
jgi:hypothetical protein